MFKLFIRVNYLDIYTIPLKFMVLLYGSKSSDSMVVTNSYAKMVAADL